MPTRFWMVYMRGDERAECYREEFATEEAARKEAERLAQLTGNTGKSVYLLETIEACQYSFEPVLKWRACQ